MIKCVQKIYISYENNNRDEHTRTLFRSNASAFAQAILFFDCALENFFHCFRGNVREPIIVERLSLLARMRSVEKGGPTYTFTWVKVRKKIYQQDFY